MTWPTKKLGEVAKYINGWAFKPSEWTDVGLPIIRIQNLTETQEKFNFYNGKIEQRYIIEKGDILLSWSASLGVYIWDKEKAVLNQHIFKVIPNEVIDKKYLFYALSHVIEEIKIQVHGSTMTHITKPAFERNKIPLPPLNIQHQIVERLDAIKKAQELSDKQIALADELFQSLLNRELNTKDQNWAEQKLGEVCDVRDGTHESPKFHPAGIPLVTSKNLVGEGIDFENINYISSEDYEEINKRSKVDNGDILFGMIGTIGNPITVKKDREFSIKNVGLIKFTKSSPINHFVYYSLLGNFIQKQIKMFSRGGTQKFVSLGNMRNLKILVPNKIIQQKIAEKLQAVQDYKKKLLEQKQKLQELFNSCLDKAMKGELVN